MDEQQAAAMIAKAQHRPIIDVQNVKKIYRVGEVKIRALDGISLTIDKGEFACIIGRSGSGKSTLLNMMAGLEAINSGQIIISGKHIERMTEAELIEFRQQQIGFVFQSFNLLPHYTAQENVALPLMFRGIGRAERSRRAREALRLVGLSTHRHHTPMQMSGGQQQRVGIARALVGNPAIVFADEPTGNLDSKTSNEIMELLLEIAQQRRTTFVMVTHDPNMAAYADKTINVLDGKATGISYKNAETTEV
ncbi:MAG: ABC transporter ATP-binding protein [Bacillota bacterium]|nr:ABC transporter ATP-binding protein [Bacillota bacterium]